MKIYAVTIIDYDTHDIISMHTSYNKALVKWDKMRWECIEKITGDIKHWKEHPIAPDNEYVKYLERVVENLKLVSPFEYSEEHIPDRPIIETYDVED
jgi:hypothetical protein